MSDPSPIRPLTIAVLVKQVPRFEMLEMDGDGRLVRTDRELEMNPYCRRAVAKGVELARESGGSCTVLTLGPPEAEDCLREAVAHGATKGVLISDRILAGSDTLATARALAAALRRLGPFDLVLCGRNSVDAETGQTPAQIAELLDLPLAAGVRWLAVEDDTISVRCEHDDGWLAAELRLPALLTCAERLVQPAKASPAARAAVPASRISRLHADALGPGRWGEAGSMTTVGATRRWDDTRLRLRFDGDSDGQLERAIAVLAELGAFDEAPAPSTLRVPSPHPRIGAGRGDIAVLAEPDRDRLTRELLGCAARLAAGTGGLVTALAASALSPAVAGPWGTDVVIKIKGSSVEEDIAAGVARWCAAHTPWAVLAPSTMWGREIAGRVAARLGAGLVGDAVDVVTDADGDLVWWKPAFNGGLVVAVRCLSATRLATIRGGCLPLLDPRAGVAEHGPDLVVVPRLRTRIVARRRDDDLTTLALAPAIVCAGAGVPHGDYPLLNPLLRVLGAELAATRKVTDQGWQPRARQVGVTGRSVAPRLYVAIAASGKFAHMAGARRAGLVLGINNDPTAPLFDATDVGIVADWRDAVPRLVSALAGLGLPAAPVLARGSTR